MLELSEKYLSRLQQIVQDIQGSEALAQYMDTEEEAEYKALCEAFEPKIAQLYAEVAVNDPLQLVNMEQILLNPYFEGLFLPRILGYSVLRGSVNSQYKYTRPQNHFKDILLAILESSNFEYIKKRIGQSVQMGFALSSDIWITDLINSVANKRLRYYLQSCKLDKYRDAAERKISLERYQAQFSKENYLTADFPASFAELKVEYPDLKRFLMYRVGKMLNNESLNAYLLEAITNEAFWGTTEHIELMCFALNFFEMGSAETAQIGGIFNNLRQTTPDFSTQYLSFIVEMHRAHFELDSKAELKASAIVDRDIKDGLTEYYRVADIIHTQGYKNEDVMFVIKKFYDEHEGLSVLNECVRRLVYGYIHRAVAPLKVREYNEYFLEARIFTQYMRLFENELFNQNLRDLSLAYVRKCLVQFVDKRAKEYQDVKRFVTNYFPEWHFMKEKDVVEMFKTRRKRKTEA